MRAVGLVACIVAAVLPPVVYANPIVAAAAAVAAAFCAAGLLLPHLGLVIAGAAGTMLVFASALLAAPETNASVAGALLGLSIWVVLSCTYFRQRFQAVSVDHAVRRAHAVALAKAALISVVAPALLAATAFLVPAIPVPYARSLLPAVGAILVMAGVLHAHRPAARDRPGRIPRP